MLSLRRAPAALCSVYVDFLDQPELRVLTIKFPSSADLEEFRRRSPGCR